jgi:hypothetical protein
MIIDEFLKGVALRLDKIPGLTVTTDPLAPIVPSMAMVLDGDIEYDASFGRGNDQLAITILVFVSHTATKPGVDAVRAFKSGHGSQSIRAALATSVGAADLIPNATLRAERGRIDQVGLSDNSGHIVLTIEATAHIPGKE